MLLNYKKVSYARYSLNPKITLNAKAQNTPHEGALLRFEFKDSSFGYADCAPWEELGDLPLTKQIELLAKNEFTPLTKKSFFFARLDAMSRAQKESLFLKKIPIKNYITTTFDKFSETSLSKVKEKGFRFVKVKCGKDRKEDEAHLIRHAGLLEKLGLKLRLDFNGILNLNQASEFLRSVESCKMVIDYIEDICPYHKKDWKYLQDTFGVPLALDRKPYENFWEIAHKELNSEKSYSVLILKPALEEIYSYLIHPPKQRVVFTSYMDHPLGQLCGYFEAQLFYKKFPDKKEDCGFLSHTVYESTPYAQLLGNDFILPRDEGFGFASLLKQENWVSLKMFEQEVDPVPNKSEDDIFFEGFAESLFKALQKNPQFVQSIVKKKGRL